MHFFPLCSTERTSVVVPFNLIHSSNSGFFFCLCCWSVFDWRASVSFEIGLMVSISISWKLAIFISGSDLVAALLKFEASQFQIMWTNLYMIQSTWIRYNILLINSFLLSFIFCIAINSFSHVFCFFFTEIEAIEACKWLRAAGFPQYAALFEGECKMLWLFFPTSMYVEDIKSVYSYLLSVILNPGTKTENQMNCKLKNVDIFFILSLSCVVPKIHSKRRKFFGSTKNAEWNSLVFILYFLYH